jgi:hypothetical protein
LLSLGVGVTIGFRNSLSQEGISVPGGGVGSFLTPQLDINRAIKNKNEAFLKFNSDSQI